MSDEYGFPLPVPGVVSQPFWDGLKEHRLLVQRCVAGGHLFLYPREFCPVCHTAELEWQPVSGRGRVHSFTVVHRAANPVFQQEKAPYVFALIQLDEGWTKICGDCKMGGMSQFVDEEPDRAGEGGIGGEGRSDGSSAL